MSALRKRPMTKKASVTIPARTAESSGRPVGLGEPEDRRAKTGGNDRRTVVTEFISTFAAKTSRGLTGDVKT